MTLLSYFLAYMLAAVLIFYLDRWVSAGDCPECGGQCKEVTLLNSTFMGLFWPLILVGVIWGSRRKK